MKADRSLALDTQLRCGSAVRDRSAAWRDWVLRFAHGLTRATESVAAILLVAIVLMNLGQVFFRYVLVAPLSWSEEAMRYSAAWMVLLAGSAALFKGEHMAIGLFEAIRSKRLASLVRHAMLVSVAGFCVLLMWKGYPAAVLNMKQLSPANQIPMVIPYLAVPVGATLMLVKVLCLMVLPATLAIDQENGEDRT